MSRPELHDGQWVNRPECGCPPDGCCCQPACEVSLPGPVADVTEVKVGGQVLPPSSYRLLDGNRLVRIDGGCWPDCQAVELPDTEPGTWSVTYRRGHPVPPGGQHAAAVLANEIWKQCTGQRGCRLPQRVEQIEREGVTYTMLNPLDHLESGRTGLAEVDGWLAQVNPRGQRTPSGVWSPDLPHAVTTGSWGAWTGG